MRKRYEHVKQAERIHTIHAILKEKGNASNKFLCSVFDVSESTVRRDIDLLASMHADVQRLHGGVVLEGSNGNLEYMFEVKLNLNREEKRRIARAAVEFVENGDRLVVDSGTTCLFAAMELHHRKDLRVITLDTKIACELAKHESIEATIVGGIVRPGFYTVGESMAIEMLDHFSVDTTIMSADAIDVAKGVTNFSIFEVGVKKKIIEMAKTVILIADHTKFGGSFFYKVTDLVQVDTIITAKELERSDPGLVHTIRDLGVTLVLV